MADVFIDYLRTGIPIPTYVPADHSRGDPDAGLADGTWLSTFICDRLMSTTIRPEGLMFVLGPQVTDAIFACRGSVCR